MGKFDGCSASGPRGSKPAKDDARSSDIIEDDVMVWYRILSKGCKEKGTLVRGVR